jgi:16S rRNA (adenine1518-N6/adenine1519-N6)-dimethyltransferase
MRAIKSLGQNFLMSPVTISKFITVVNAHPHDTILEVGPGTGALTKPLSEISSRLIAVEKDDYLASQLKREFHRSNSVKILNEDILESTIHQHIEGTYVIVGSLPYNISKQIIRKFLLEEHNRPTHLHVVIQKEVGESYTAQPPQMTYLSAFANIYSRPELNFTIPRTHFSPVPEVDGAFVTFTMKTPPPYHRELNAFFRALFKSPRKTLKNNIENYLTSTESEKGKTGTPTLPSSIKENARAAELSFEQLSDLFFVYNSSYQHEGR